LSIGARAASPLVERRRMKSDHWRPCSG
jgi:hypothetical protein